MIRSVTFRVGAACAAIAFAVTSGLTGMETHPLSAHGSLTHGVAATDVVEASAHRGDAHASHRATATAEREAPESAHAGHSSHGSSEECTCVGPCQGGVAPTLSAASFAAVQEDEADRVRVVRAPTRLIEQDPRSYLHPFPNAPPARV